MKVKALSQIVDAMNAVQVSGLTQRDSNGLIVSPQGHLRGVQEGPALARLLQRVLDEADSSDTDPALRQKYYATALDTMCRIEEMQSKVAADLMDLEGKRAETRMKRRLLKKQMGFKGDTRVSAQVIAKDVLVDVASQLRGADHAVE